MTEMPTLGVFGMVMGMKILIFGLERIKLLRCCCRASTKFATANTYTKHCCQQDMLLLYNIASITHKRSIQVYLAKVEEF